MYHVGHFVPNKQKHQQLHSGVFTHLAQKPHITMSGHDMLKINDMLKITETSNQPTQKAKIKAIKKITRKKARKLSL